MKCKHKWRMIENTYIYWNGEHCINVYCENCAKIKESRTKGIDR